MSPARLRYPQSFLSLLLVGFAIIVAPLIAGLISNAFAIDGLAERSQSAILRVKDFSISTLSSPTGASAASPAAVQAASASVDAELEGLRSDAARAKQRVFWQVLAMIPAAILLVAGFTFLIARPISALDAAIHRLGQGKLAKRVRVDGPSDIVRLGDQLDWLRQRLISLEDDKTRFFQHVSHELKTPLTAITQGVQLMSDRAIGELNTDQREVARILTHNAHALERLIQDLLTYSQLQNATRTATTVQLDTDWFELDELIDTILPTLQLSLRQNDLQVHFERVHAALVGDRTKLRTVIDNLLSNAVKHSPRGGQLSIDLVATPTHITLGVEDEGPGIRASERTSVFVPFFRSHQTMNAAISGSGLGLAIARDYVELHGGSIEALARRDGRRGARFQVSLPLAPTTTDSSAGES